MKHPRVVGIAVMWLCGLAFMALASDKPPPSSPLDPATSAEVAKILDAARADGLPTGPLKSKALEGAAKGSPPARIVAVVRAHAGALAEARAALGASSGDAELEAGAVALLAGVPSDSLARLRAARPGRSIVVPLVVMADLIARRVPPTAAATSVLLASRAGVADPELLRMRSRVERDIASGTAPASAAESRARWLAEHPGGTASGEAATPVRPRGKP